MAAAPAPPASPLPPPRAPRPAPACPHLEPEPRQQPSVPQPSLLSCIDCGCKEQNLWMCLHKECTHVGCSENHNDHSTQHYKDNTTHCVHMNVMNKHVWCYECHREVFPFTVFSRVLHLPENANYTNQVGNNVSGGLKGAGERMRVISSFGLDRGPGLNVSGVGDSQESSDADDDEALDYNYDGKPRGLVGLQNIGNTCYMNSAIQALSNTPPLTQYFLDCSATVDFLTENKKPGVSRSYQKLVKEIWNKKTLGYVVPNGILYGIRNVHPMFRGYHQHDTQEFLRCFMDQLHEELKEPVRDNKETRKAHSDTNTLLKYITKQPGLQAQLTNHTSCQAIITRTNECDDKIKDVRRQKSPARSFDDIPFATSNRYYRVNTQTDDSEVNLNISSNYGHRRSASYCDPCGYSQLPQDMKSNGESGNSSPRSVTPVEYMDQENSEKELDDDDEETYETCDSGASDAGSISDTENHTSHSSIGFKRKYENVEKRISESETNSDSTTNTTKYRSVISDVFDGRLLSSVQCLTCDRISTRVETFKDLSLPIPSRDHMAVLHNSSSTISGSSGSSTSSSSNGGRSTACSDAVYSATSSQEGWVWWFLGWLRSWLYGPSVTLHDCLAAFFSADELKGDNMYSCEKCNKLRNGVKYSKVLALPEVLCVHLKRFRHELMSSTKIGAKVSFPLTGLDMRPYLHKDCSPTVSTYELVAIICHTGTAGAGHYTCVARNRHAGTWFEFDDQYVTSLTPEQVAACEAYVLFYKKHNPRMTTLRQKAMELFESACDFNTTKYFISKQWINRFNTYAEPGAIDNSDFLCSHGGVPPDRVSLVERLTTVIPRNLWEFLYQNFGGGPACSQLYECVVCRIEAEKLQKRQNAELQEYTCLHYEFILEQEQDIPTSIYAINMNWFKLWMAFARNKSQQIPPPIDNSGIVPKVSIHENHSGKSTSASLSNYDYAQVNEALWKFFYDIYGGGPEVKLKSAPNTMPNGQSFNNVSEHSNYTSSNTLKSPVQPELAAPNCNTSVRKDSNGDKNCTDGPYAKSLSNVDLFSMEQKCDNGYGKLSVKGTQSLQDVSVRQHKNNNIVSNSVQNSQYKEMENQTMLVETSDGVIEYTLKTVPLTNGSDSDYNVRSNSKANVNSEHSTNKTKQKKGKVAKKSVQYNNASQKESVPETFHKKPQKDNFAENSVDVHNSVANNHSLDAGNSLETENACNNVENDAANDVLSSDADLPNMEAISLKPKVEPSPSVHQHVAKSNKNRKLSGKKLRRQQSGGNYKRNASAKSPDESPTPLVNGGDKTTK